MLNTIILVCLVAALIIFLLWRRTSRAIVFEAVCVSGWIFAIAYLLTLEAANRFSPNLLNSFILYFPAILPVIAFLVWLLRRTKVLVR
jgi:hypothetical protein